MSTYEEDLRIIEAAEQLWEKEGWRSDTFINHFGHAKCRELVEENQRLRDYVETLLDVLKQHEAQRPDVI